MRRGAALVAITTIALLLLAGIPALAIQYDTDFDLNTNQASLCPGNTVQVLGTVTNMGDTTKSYDVKASVDWVTIAPNSFSLAPQESGTVYIYVTPPFGEEPGEKTVTITLRDTATNTEYKQELTVNVEQCHAVSLEVEPQEYHGCIGGDAKFILTITNNGKYEETFVISSDEGIIENKKVTLEPAHSAQVEMTVPVTDTLEKTIITVKSLQSYATATGEVLVRADKQCYGVAVISIPPEQRVCQGEQAEYAITIKNVGAKAQTFTLSADINGTFGTKELTLEGGEVGETYFRIPTEGLEEGEKTFTVRVESEKAFDTATTKLVVKDCYALEASAPEVVEVCPGKEAVITVSLKNTGERADTYTITPTKGETTKNEVSLEPGERKEVAIAIPTNPLDTGEEKVLIEVSSPHEHETLETVIRMREINECYGATVTIEPPEIKAQDYKGVLFTVRVRNTGEFEDHYTVELSGPDWVRIDPKEFSLGPGEEATLYMYAYPEYGTPSGDYELMVKIRDEVGIETTATATFSFERAGGEEEVTAPTGELVQPEGGKEKEEKPNYVVLVVVLLGIVIAALLIFWPGGFEGRKTRPSPPIPPSEVSVSLESVKGVGKKRAEALRKAGIKSVSDLANANPKRVAELTGIREGMAKRIVNEAKKLAKKESRDQEKKTEKKRGRKSEREARLEELKKAIKGEEKEEKKK